MAKDKASESSQPEQEAPPLHSLENGNDGDRAKNKKIQELDTPPRNRSHSKRKMPPSLFPAPMNFTTSPTLLMRAVALPPGSLPLPT